MQKVSKKLYPQHIQVGNQKELNYCGIRCFFEVLGGKWKLLILASLFNGTKRYGELKKEIPEISEKMLIASLRELELYGMVTRKIYHQVPPQVEYA